MNLKVVNQVLSSLGFDFDKGTVFNPVKNSTTHTTLVYENKSCCWRFSFVDFGPLQGPNHSIQRFYCVGWLESSDDEVGFLGHYKVCDNYPLVTLNEIEAEYAKGLIRGTVRE